MDSRIAANRRLWNEWARINQESEFYDMAGFRAGQTSLKHIELEEVGEVAGKSLLHLQCHFGADTLCLAQRGATVVGLDFSEPAIAAARGLADELGLANRVRFVCADLYDAPSAVDEVSSFDLVYVTWGTTCWLPDVRRWAGIVAHFLKPGGRLYYADGHPAAYVFDNETKLPDGRPGYFAPYFQREPLVMSDDLDYADPDARLTNATNVNWMHPLADIVGGLIDAGLSLDWLHEHAQVPWQMFRILVKRDDGDWHWPDKQWLPLAVSLQATRRSD